MHMKHPRSGMHAAHSEQVAASTRARALATTGPPRSVVPASSFPTAPAGADGRLKALEPLRQVGLAASKRGGQQQPGCVADDFQGLQVQRWRGSRAAGGRAEWQRQLAAAGGSCVAARRQAMRRDRQLCGGMQRRRARPRGSWREPRLRAGRCRLGAAGGRSDPAKDFCSRPPCLFRHAWPGRRPSCPARRRLPPALLPPFFAFRRSCSGQGATPEPANAGQRLQDPAGWAPSALLCCLLRHAGAAARPIRLSIESHGLRRIYAGRAVVSRTNIERVECSALGERNGVRRGSPATWERA